MTLKRKEITFNDYDTIINKEGEIGIACDFSEKGMSWQDIETRLMEESIVVETRTHILQWLLEDPELSSAIAERGKFTIINVNQTIPIGHEIELKPDLED